MVPDLLSISHLLFCIMDVYMLYRFMKSMFKKKMKQRGIIIFSLTIIFTIFIENAFGSTGMNFMTIPLLYLLYSMVVFDISIPIGIVYTVIYFTIFTGGREAALELLNQFLSRILPLPVYSWNMSESIYYMLGQYTFAFLFLLFMERFTSKLDMNLDDQSCWYLLVLPISSLIVMSCFVYMEFPESIVVQALRSIGAFLLYLTNAVVFIVLEKYSEIQKQIKYAELNKVKKDMEIRNYESIEKINSVYREYMHEMRKYFSSFRNLAAEEDTQKIINVINELEGKIQTESKSIIYSGNSVLNGILSENAWIAAENGVELTIFVEQFLNVDFISDGDMISLFGNLFDNAMEAAMKCEPGKRKVDVKFYMGSDYFLILEVKNSYTGDATRSGSRFLSTKKDTEYHGQGVGIVRKIAEKYSGTVDLQEGAEEFSALLTIPVR